MRGSGGGGVALVELCFHSKTDLLVLLFLLASCGSTIPLHTFEEEIPKASPDYTNINHWIAHPDKFDNSEKLPENVVNDTFKLDSIDVFFVYPTLYFDGLEWNSS